MTIGDKIEKVSPALKQWIDTYVDLIGIFSIFLDSTRHDEPRTESEGGKLYH